MLEIYETVHMALTNQTLFYQTGTILNIVNISCKKFSPFIRLMKVVSKIFLGLWNEILMVDENQIFFLGYFSIQDSKDKLACQSEGRGQGGLKTKEDSQLVSPIPGPLIYSEEVAIPFPNILQFARWEHLTVFFFTSPN